MGRQTAVVIAVVGVVLSSATAVGGASAVAAVGTSVASDLFTSVSPTRILDTRRGIGGSARAVAGRGTLSLQVAGVAGIPLGVAAVAVNITVASPRVSGYLTAYPSGIARPASSSVNFTAGKTTPNFAIVPVGADGKVDFFNGSSGSLSLIADVSGYYRQASVGVPGGFGSVSPARILDTRIGVGAPAAKVARRGSVTFQVTGRGAVPAGVTAVAVNLTVTGPTTSGYLTAYPAATARATSSDLNFGARQTVSNFAIVPVSASGQITLFNGSGGTVAVIADVSGYFTGSPSGSVGTFGPIAPSRVLDTRSGLGAPAGPLGQQATLSLTVLGRGGVPASNVAAVAVNITVAGPAASGYLSAYPTGTVRPGSSSVNFGAHQAVPNFAIVPVGADGRISLYNGSGGTVSVIVDVSGYFVGSPGGSLVGWGNGLQGQLGTPTAANALAPAPVPGLSGVIAASVGAQASHVVTADGSVWAFGNNLEGQLGDNTLTNHLTPERLTGLSHVIAVADEDFVGCALKSDGTVWGWGNEATGLLVGFETEPTPIYELSAGKATPLTGVTAIAAGYDTGYFLKSDGTVWAWGDNTYGELGSGTTVRASSLAVQVSGLSGVVGISAGALGGYALLADGTVRAWGSDTSGQLGDGTETRTTRSTPAPVKGLSGVIQIAGGSSSGYALTASGVVKAWGLNSHGELGDGTTTNRLTPVTVKGLDGTRPVTSIAAISNTAYATYGGAVLAWGYNASGQVGDATTVNRLTYQTVLTNSQSLSSGASAQTELATLQAPESS